MHLVVKALRERGILCSFFVKKHNLNIHSFRATISGKYPNKKVIKALRKEKLLTTLHKEFPNFKKYK